jgi:anti-sigma regulatory factor (Ser/Thr protein kinase)
MSPVQHQAAEHLAEPVAWADAPHRWTFSRTGKRGDVAHRVQQSRYAFKGFAEKLFGNSDRTSELELAAEELLVNAAEHGDGPTVTVSFIVCGNTLRLEVHDGGTAPIGKPDDDELAETGRGWFLVRAFTDKCGIDQDRRGTTAWFTVVLR